ncbi:hypothetical protein LMG18091_04448 [Ralstonia wenshanensis]|uniref:Uncharacterized protein n=1 Tax=Ralstonia wenshanensis TaxID=2842456 RepID=A0AAD2ESE3_9RALS|nr:hypothetical protein LMG18091_04448 [Ralstonia wenshanensis]
MIRGLCMRWRWLIPLPAIFICQLATAQSCPAGKICLPVTYTFVHSVPPYPVYPSLNAACAGELNGSSAIIKIPGGEIVATKSACTGAGLVGGPYPPTEIHLPYACTCTVTAFDGSVSEQQTIGGFESIENCPAGTWFESTILGCVGPAPAQQPCPVSDLTPITDPLALENESGQYSTSPDLERATPAIQTAAQCVVAAAQSYAPGGWARVNSAYRPQTYQNHIREVWDKWMLLKDNNMPQCAALKARVIQEKAHKHHLVAQPGITSQHSVGKAMDLSISPYSDNMRAYLRQHCNLKQPVPNDKVHYEPN